MVRIVILTGFLGAGKTTLLKEVLNSFMDHKVGVIMNEFGEVGIDGRIIEDETFEMIELNNGSIFCACLKDSFIQSIIKMLEFNLDYIFIECSGISDPSNMNQISHIVKQSSVQAYEYVGSICVVDGEYFFEILDMLPAVERQIKFSNAIIINKMDLIDEVGVTKIKKEIIKMNPKSKIYVTSYCKVDYKKTIADLKNDELLNEDSVNTRENRPVSIRLSCEESITSQSFRLFLKEISQFTYRIKGFFKLDNKWYTVSVVKNTAEIMFMQQSEIKSEIVIISSIGISIITKVQKAWEKYMDVNFMIQ